MNNKYQVQLSVDFPDRDLDRLTSALRVFTVIPIAIVLWSLEGFSGRSGAGGSAGATTIAVSGTGLLFLPPLLMIVFREKYPRWWFDWNLQLLRFITRVSVYFLLMDDHYPSTDEEQGVHLEFAYPDVQQELNRWLPLVKWFLAIPHYVVLIFLDLGAILVVIGAWFTIIVTGRYPRGMFDYVEGVIRWNVRVTGYAIILIPDQYPPFRLRP